MRHIPKKSPTVWTKAILEQLRRIKQLKRDKNKKKKEIDKGRECGNIH